LSDAESKIPWSLPSNPGRIPRLARPKGESMDSEERPTDILSPSEAARCVGLAVSTLGKLRCWGGGPEFLKLGRKVAYRRAALDEWLAARAASNTSDAARLPTRLADPPHAA
jgi:predicted DNA-binding transcriptional regulator AlpA